VVGDAHIRERELLVRVEDDELGTAPLVQDALPRMSASPGHVRTLGEPVGFDPIDSTEFGCSSDEIRELAAKGTIRVP
jgi:crotonobetainyl-CoA:carnitine CoA-transferase CaiB-like acyl-CoA transferase